MQPEDRLDALLSSDLVRTSRPGALPGDDALEPLLVAAAALQPLREAHPSAAFADALEARLLAHLSSGVATTAREPVRADDIPVPLSAPKAIPSSRVPRRAPAMRRSRFLWPAVAAAVLVLALGTLTVAASAGPGSPLYGLHRMEQGVRVAFSSDPADRVRLHLSYASDALSAANAAAHTGDDATFGDALATLRSELSAATTELSSIPPGFDHDILAAQLTSLRSRAVTGLRTDLPPLNWTERFATTDALAEFGAGVPRVTSATAQRTQNPSMHTWHVVITGTGFTPGAQLLVDGQPVGTVVSVSDTTLIADYTASDGQPPASLGVANPDDTAAQTSRVAIVPPGQSATPGPANTPGAGSSGDHGGGSGKGGHGGDRPPTPTPPTPPTSG